MAELKTKQTQVDVGKFVASIADPQKRADAEALVQLMGEITGVEPKMWGPSIVGFGSYHYVYDSGREGDWFVAGFSPRARNLTLYLMGGFDGHDAMLAKLGKYKTGKACLYVNKLADVDMKVLRRLVAASTKYIKMKYAPTGEVLVTSKPAAKKPAAAKKKPAKKKTTSAKKTAAKKTSASAKKKTAKKKKPAAKKKPAKKKTAAKKTSAKKKKPAKKKTSAKKKTAKKK